MMEQQSGKIAFGAMMIALTVMFLFIYQFVPAFGFVARFLVPVPIAIAVLRHDVITGLLVAMIASLLVGFLGGPLAILGIFVLFTPLALVAGGTLAANWSAWRTFIASTGAQIIGAIIFYALTIYMLGFELSDFAAYYQQMEKEVWDFYQASGALEQLKDNGLTEASIKKNIAIGVKWTIRLAPALLVIASAAVSQVVLVLTRLIANRLGLEHQKPAPFTQWIVPAYFILPILLAWAVLLFSRQTPLPEGVLVVALNIMLPALVAVMISGASFFFNRLRLTNSSHLFRFILIALIVVFIQGFILVSLIAGLFDTLLDFRKIRTGKDRVL